jgi:hypothetical protein
LLGMLDHALCGVRILQQRHIGNSPVALTFIRGACGVRVVWPDPSGREDADVMPPSPLKKKSLMLRFVDGVMASTVILQYA